MKSPKLILLITGISVMALLAACSKAPEITMVPIPGENFEIGRTEVTQKQFKAVMKINPSTFKGDELPVHNISWNDGAYFCNALSIMCGLEPVYSVDGNTNPKEWKYTPCNNEKLSDNLKINAEANGYRMPTLNEWMIAAKAGQDFVFAGSNNLDEVAWSKTNSDGMPHEVAQLKPNAYGLYDMSGNVWEWTNTSPLKRQRNFVSGSWKHYRIEHHVDMTNVNTYASSRDEDIGIRLCRTLGTN